MKAPDYVHKGFQVRQEGSQVRQVSRVQQEIPEEGWRAHQPERCTDNNKDEDNSPNNPNNSNYQASSQKFKEMFYFYLLIF